MIKQGDKINLHIDWCDSKEESEIDYVVLEVRGEEFPSLLCEAQIGWNINPTEVIEYHMLFALPE